MNLTSIYSVPININIIGIITTGILIGTFCILSILYFIYIDRNKVILYLISYLFFVFCGLFVSSIFHYQQLSYFASIKPSFLFSLQILFDYCMIYCLFLFGVFLLQRRLYIISVILSLALPIMVFFGNYSFLEVLIFLFYLTLCFCILLYVALYEKFYTSLKQGILYSIIYFSFYVYYFLSYTIPSNVINFRTLDWIACSIIVLFATFYLVARYSSLIAHKNLLYNRLIHDNLTGLYSKNYQLEIVSRTESGSILFIDINNFKQVNDNYGHLVGDQLLYRFSQSLLQKNDDFSVTSCRFGGDEFVLLLENASLENIQLYTHHLMCVFKDFLKELSVDYNKYHIGISIGMSNFSNFSGKKAIISADFAMYESKSLGNNHLSIRLEEVL